MRYTLRKYPNSKMRRNFNATATATSNTVSGIGKGRTFDKNGGSCVISDCASHDDDKVIKKEVTTNQKIGDNMNPTVRLVDIGAVKIYQRKGYEVITSQVNQKTGNHFASATKDTTNTATGKSTTKKDTTLQVLNEKKKTLVNMQPVVRLIDCYESLFSLSAIIAAASSSSAFPPKIQKRAKRRGNLWTRRTPKGKASLPPILQDLKSRGLKEFKLSDLAKKSSQNSGPVINVKAITNLLVNACTVGNAPNRHNRPFDLEDPWEECLAITEALQIYADHVTPEESLGLFEPTSTPTNPGGVSTKTWQYLSTLGNSHFFFKMMRIPGGSAVFESKMVGIMKAGVEVDAFNWTLTEVGSILGFWLAKLYNGRGISDDDLPLELNLAKQHFMELNGWEYDKAVLHNFPLN